jgi:rubrerythrin
MSTAPRPFVSSFRPSALSDCASAGRPCFLFDMTTIAPHALHITRTACLVESRAHLYSRYLTSVFHPRFADVFERWGAEEATHGQRLRAWLAEHDPSFDFERHMANYLAHVPYHPETGESVYGSQQGELVSRCFVEAMAASYYQALGRGAPELTPLCRALAADEARHFTMFRRLLAQLRAEEGLRPLEAVLVIKQRFASFDDDQILYASWCVRDGANEGPFVRSEESQRYRTMMWKLYRPEHIRFVATLTLQTLGLSVAPGRLGWLSALVQKIAQPRNFPPAAS